MPCQPLLACFGFLISPCTKHNSLIRPPSKPKVMCRRTTRPRGKVGCSGLIYIKLIVPFLPHSPVFSSVPVWQACPLLCSGAVLAVSSLVERCKSSVELRLPGTRLAVSLLNQRRRVPLPQMLLRLSLPSKMLFSSTRNPINTLTPNCRGVCPSGPVWVGFFSPLSSLHCIRQGQLPRHCS